MMPHFPLLWILSERDAFVSRPGNTHHQILFEVKASQFVRLYEYKCVSGCYRQNPNIKGHFLLTMYVLNLYLGCKPAGKL